jgi:hypothetical protein
MRVAYGGNVIVPPAPELMSANLSDLNHTSPASNITPVIFENVLTATYDPIIRDATAPVPEIAVILARA